MLLRNKDLELSGRVPLVGRHLLDGDVLGGHAIGCRRDVVLAQPDIDLQFCKFTIYIFTIYKSRGCFLTFNSGVICFYTILCTICKIIIVRKNHWDA